MRDFDHTRRVLTLFHDVTSPASAVAVIRMSRLAAEGVPITFEGFEAVGLDLSLPPDLDTLAMVDRLHEEAEAEGIVLRRPRVMPPTGLAHVLMTYAETQPSGPQVREALYRAYWEDGVDVADPSALRRVAMGAGLEDGEVERLLADRVALASRRRQMAAHRREGVGGVPVILASRTLIPGLLSRHDILALAASV